MRPDVGQTWVCAGPGEDALHHFGALDLGPMLEQEVGLHLPDGWELRVEAREDFPNNVFDSEVVCKLFLGTLLELGDLQLVRKSVHRFGRTRRGDVSVGGAVFVDGLLTKRMSSATIFDETAAWPGRVKVSRR